MSDRQVSPPCPSCGHTTTLHCRYCDWWECLACDIRGVGTHSIPRTAKKKEGQQ